MTVCLQAELVVAQAPVGAEAEVEAGSRTPSMICTVAWHALVSDVMMLAGCAVPVDCI